jgi:hypothetical protein
MWYVESIASTAYLLLTPLFYFCFQLKKSLTQYAPTLSPEIAMVVLSSANGVWTVVPDVSYDVRRFHAETFADI